MGSLGCNQPLYLEAASSAQQISPAVGWIPVPHPSGTSRWRTRCKSPKGCHEWGSPILMGRVMLSTLLVPAGRECQEEPGVP